MEDENWWEASAKVTTDAEKHVSIIKYEFAEDESREYRKYFTIENGIITFNPDQKDNIVPGEKVCLEPKTYHQSRRTSLSGCSNIQSDFQAIQSAIQA